MSREKEPREKSLGERTLERNKAKFATDQAKLVQRDLKSARDDHKWDKKAYPNNPNNKAKSKELKRRKKPDYRVESGGGRRRPNRPKVGGRTVSNDNLNGNGSGRATNEVLIGILTLGATAALAAGGGARAEATAPTNLQTGAEQSNVHVMKDVLPRQGLLVDLSQKRGK
jgi:hypothetical protein